MDNHTILAGDSGFGTVSVCPGGVVHVNLPHVSLKFVPEDFVKFSDLIAKARANYREEPEPVKGKPRLHLVSSDSDEDESPESDDHA